MAADKAAAVSLGIIGYALLAFTLGVKYLPLFPQEEELEEGAAATISPDATPPRLSPG